MQRVCLNGIALRRFSSLKMKMIEMEKHNLNMVFVPAVNQRSRLVLGTTCITGF